MEAALQIGNDMETPSSTPRRIDLAVLRRMKAEGRKFAMLTAYDHPTAVAGQAAGVHSLLVGDSLGTVLLGHPNTRAVPLALMVTLAEAVRRGAPLVYLIGDMPYEAIRDGAEAVVAAARRFRDEAGCDAVKIEAGSTDDALVARLVQSGIETIAHLGLRRARRAARTANVTQVAETMSLIASSPRKTYAGWRARMRVPATASTRLKESSRANR